MASTYKNKYSGTSFEYNRRQYPVPLADGTIINVWVHPEIMDETGSDGVTPLYSQEDRNEYLLRQIRKQYDLSPGQIAGGLYSEVQGGLSLFTDDEIGGALEAATGTLGGDVDANIDAIRAKKQMFQMQHPWLTAGAQAIGATVPVALDYLAGTRGGAAAMYGAGRAASTIPLGGQLARTGAPKQMLRPSLQTSTAYPMRGGLAPRSMLPDASIAMRDTLNPFRLGAANQYGLGARTVFESGAKGGMFGAGMHLGSGEGSLAERAEGIGGPTVGGFALGSAIPSGLNIGSRLFSKSTWKHNPFTAEGRLERRRNTLENQTRQAIVAGEHDVAKEYTILHDELNAINAGTEPRTALLERELGFSRRPYYRDATGQATPLNPATLTLGHARYPRDTSGTMYGALAARSGETLNIHGRPFLGQSLASLFNWAGKVDPQQAVAVSNKLRETGFGNESARINQLIRSLTSGQPMAFNLRAKILEKGERAKEVWGTLYDKAYFHPDLNMRGDRIPRIVNLSSDGNFVRMMENGEDIFRTALKDAKLSRQADMASGDWSTTIDGISQELPTYEMLLKGERWISKSSWSRNKGRLRNEWSPVTERSGRGTKMVEDTAGLNYLIKNKNGRPVDVKTMHDIRHALWNMAKTEENPRLRHGYEQVWAKFDTELKNAAGTDFRLADLEFQRMQNVSSAATAGETAILRKGEVSSIFIDEFNALNSAEEKAVFRAGVLQQLQGEKVTAAQLLEDPQMREKLRGIFVSQDDWGKFVGELASAEHAAKMTKGFDVQFTGGGGPADKMFNSMLWTALAKVPAYKFSAPFALSRDIVSHSRTLASSKNKIIAKEILRLGQAQTPMEIAHTLDELAAAYQSAFPEDASQIARLAAGIRQALLPSEQEMIGPNKVAREIYGLLGGST